MGDGPIISIIKYEMKESYQKTNLRDYGSKMFCVKE
jgi:hypothetical protein